MDEIKAISKRNEEIREELRKNGYVNKEIGYEEFLKIYAPYKQEMSEQDFASVIKISYTNYLSIKNKDSKAKILKKQLPKKTKESKKSKVVKPSAKRVEEIRKEIKQKGYINKSINYDEFKELYKPYEQEMSEKDFSEILEISSYIYVHRKTQGMKILKKEEITRKREEEIYQLIIGKVGTKKKIGYAEFVELYEAYKTEMSEQKFAEVLGISISSYRNIKANSNNNTVLGKRKEKITEERIKQVMKELKQRGYLNASIDYDEFLKIYAPYKGEIRKSDFFKILGIKESAYSNMKNNGKRVKILIEGISPERIQEIKQELKSCGYANKYIYYEELKEMYEQYKSEMTEKEFASILGLEYMNYKKIQSRKQRAKILRGEMTEQDKQEIEKNLKKAGYANKLIEYKQFLELYEAYKQEITEAEFAGILRDNI